MIRSGVPQTVRPDFHHAFDMDLAARMVSESPVELARRFCLMESGADVRVQLSRLTSQLAWMRHVVLRPNMPGPTFIEACGRAVNT